MSGLLFFLQQERETTLLQNYFKDILERIPGQGLSLVLGYTAF